MKKLITPLLLSLCVAYASPAWSREKKKDRESAEVYTPVPDLIVPKCIAHKIVAPIEEAKREKTNWNEHRFGIDVSHYQNRIDWDKVAQDPNAKYAYLKATEGASLVDDTYFFNLKEARRVGIKVGCYHFFSPTASPEDQFRNFTSTVDIKQQDLIPIIDVENKGRGNVTDFCNRLRRFLISVENHYKIKPIIYTSSHFYNKYLAGKFTEYKYMIARYHDEEPILTDDIQFVMWQFTASGRITGIRGDVDRSKFMDNYDMNDILIK